MKTVEDMLKYVLLDEATIQNRIVELGKQITLDYGDCDEELVLICILKGGFVFMADLARAIDIPVSIDFMSVSSYGNTTESSGDVRIILDLGEKVVNKHVLIVEDIVDTGNTLSYLKHNFGTRGAKSVKIVTLLNKPERRTTDIEVEYCGFNIPDEFVIGYGLDFAQKYRNLPFIGVLKEEAYQG